MPDRTLVLRDVLLSSPDGLVQQQNRLWFHFQKYPWSLDTPGANPSFGDHHRLLQQRLVEGLPNPKSAQHLSGAFHLGLSPHIHSYYHLLTDLLPHLLATPRYPMLVPENWPPLFADFLCDAGFEVKPLSSGTFHADELWLPAMGSPDWTSEKLRTVRAFFAEAVPELKNRPHRKLYLTRKKAKRRHLINEDELLPRLHRYGYELVVSENLTIPEQVHRFREATHLVAPHGAGLVNGLFMPCSARILEIRPVPESGGGCFDALFQLGWPGHEVLVPPDSGRFVLPLDKLSAVLDRWRLEEKTRG